MCRLGLIASSRCQPFRLVFLTESRGRSKPQGVALGYHLPPLRGEAPNSATSKLALRVSVSRGGVGDRDGWLFIAVGGVALFAAFFAPVWTTGGPRIVREPVVADPAAEAPADTPAEEATPTPSAGRSRGIRLPHPRRQAEPRVGEPSSS